MLANDTDVDGGPISIASVTQPADGTVVITGGGTGLTYQPDADYCNTPPGTSTDDFSYTLNGGSAATVAVTVDCGDDPPVALNDSATVAEDAAATNVDVLANDADFDGGLMAVESITQPVNGTVAIVGSGMAVSYTPAQDYCNDPPGAVFDTFTYTVNGGSTATVTMTVTCVDDAPVAVADSATVAEDAAAAAVDVLANDTDIDGGPKSVASVTQPANGTVVITGGGTGVTYQPDADYCNAPPGTTLDTFTYTLTPGSSSTTVSVSVTCGDDDPGAVADSATVSEDAAATAVDVLANDTDVDGGPISVASVTQPANGTVVITGGGTGLTYEPDADYCNAPPGTTLDTFTYALTPGGSSATVAMTVTCVDDAPGAVADSETVSEDAAAAAVNVLANDTDVDGGPISVASVTQPANGTVVITGGGTGLTYQPDPDYCGSDTFAYTLTPGGSSATVAMTVTCVDDAPVAVADSATVAEDAAAAAVDVLANDTDIDGGPKSVASVTQPANGTVVITGGGTGVTYQPDADYCNAPPGTTLDTFTYTLTPGSSSTTVTMTVTCVNDAPVGPSTLPSYDVMANMTFTGAGLLTGVTDPDGPTTLSAALVAGPVGGSATVNADGTFTAAPPAGATGDVTFTYRVCDDGFPAPPACSESITATLDVAGPVIWFVDDSAAAGGDGTLSAPFQTLAAATTEIGAATNERIFLFDGSYTGGATLNTSGWLIGQASTNSPSTFDALFGISPPTGTQARPAVGTAGPVTVGGSVTLGTNSAVKGIAITTTNGGIAGTSVAGVDVSQTRVTTTNGPALSLSAVGGTVALTNVAQTAGTTGIDLASSSAAVTVTDGSISGTSSAAIRIVGGTGSVSADVAVTVATGRAIEVADRTGTSNVTFPGPVTANGGTGISLTGNTATTTIRFTNTLTLSTGANPAFRATGGTVTATGAGSTLTTTTATALEVAGATIGAGDLTFRSISAGTVGAGPSGSGIVLANTGTAATDGGLVVTGTAVDHSGGTIQRTGAAGISLTNTRDVSFNEMLVQDTTGSGIAGTGVVNFSLTNSTVRRNGAVGVANTSNVAFNSSTTAANLTGVVVIDTNLLTDAAWHGVDILNVTGTITSATITDNLVGSIPNPASSFGSGVRIHALGSPAAVASVTTADLSGNSVVNFPSGAGIQVLGGNANSDPGAPAGVMGSVATPITIAGNIINGASTTTRMGTSAIIATVNGKGSGAFAITNNGTVADPLANMAGTAILAGGNGNTTTTFTITGNQIDANNTVASPGIGIGTGITFAPTDTPVVTATISNNTIRRTDGNGILAVAREAAGTLNATITGNVVSAPLTGTRPGIRVDAGNGPSTGDRVCLAISDNTSAGSGVSQGIGLRRETTPVSATFGIVGAGASTSTPALENYVNTQNPAGGGTLLIAATTGFSSCVLP